MSLPGLSPAAHALLKEVFTAATANGGRTDRLVSALHKADERGEPALIPELVGFLLDDAPTVAVAAGTALAALCTRLPAAQLAALDESMRASWGYFSPSRWAERWQRMAPEQVNLLVRPDPVQPVLLLGLACCHASGYVRRNAVAALDQRTSTGTELSFLLLRLDDWVAPVRLQAEAAVRQRLEAAHRPTYLAHLALVERLRAKQRAAHSPVLPRIERLLQDDVATLLTAVFMEPSRVARRYGLALAWQAAKLKGAAAVREVIERTLHESQDQALRLQVARWITAKEADGTLQREYAERLFGDKLPAMRRVALGWCVTHEPEAHQRLLRTALLDRSRSMRSIAQFYLPRLEPVDLRGFYRGKVLAGDNTHLLPAVGGLAETGKAEDIKLLLPFIHDPRTAVYKAALAGIAKLAGASGKHLELFVAVLQDGNSPGVSREARLALEPCATEIGRERLASIFFGSPYPHVRRQALSLINRLPKWQRVALLVEVVGRGNPEEENAVKATNFLRDWFAGYNRSHAAAPAPADVINLANALKRYDGALDAALGRELQALVDSLRR